VDGLIIEKYEKKISKKYGTQVTQIYYTESLTVYDDLIKFDEDGILIVVKNDILP
jgi:hypothetical protein